MKRTLHLTFFFLLLSVVAGIGQASISIAEAREANADGILTRLDENVVLEGKAIGPNFRPGGQTFVLYDVQGSIGITVFSLDSDLGYTVTDYENIRVTGALKQFNGLAEIEPTSIEVLGAGGFNPATGLVTDLDESTESKLVKYSNASLVDPSQWQNTGSFNVDITNGSTTIQVRIDEDTEISGMPAPTGTFGVTGIGGQFDQNAPYDSGYQLFPRYISDIDPYLPGGGGGSPYTPVTMNQLRDNNAIGEPMMNGQKVEITSIVYGVNLNPGGLQFTLINEDNVGVGVYSNGDNFGYTVTEGDLVKVQGTLEHFNGLTQIIVDAITLESVGNPTLQSGKLVSELNESTESSLVQIFVYGATDASTWLGDGSSFEVEYLDQSGAPFLVRIDEETYWASQPYPGDAGIICRGIGGQYDPTANHDEGYQMLPRYFGDLSERFLSTYNLTEISVDVFPNPVRDVVSIESESDIKSISVMNMMGQTIKTSYSSRVSMSDLENGNYVLKIDLKEGTTFRKIIKL